MKKRIALLCALTTMTVGAFQSANGQIAAEWDFDTYTISSLMPDPLGGTIFDPAIDSATVLRSVGISAFDDPTNYLADGWGAALDPDKFFEFSFDIDPLSDDFNAKLFSVSMTRGANPTGGPIEFDVLASVDGGAFLPLGMVSMPIPIQSATESFDLSGLGLVSDNLTIRLFGYDSENTGDYGGFWNGLTGSKGPFSAGAILKGNVIPEPSTYALIFGGFALGIVIFRRRLGKKEISEVEAVA